MNSDHRKTATDIFLAGVQSVKPDNLIKRFVSLDGTDLTIKEMKFDLSRTENVYVIGAGKACALMAKAIEDILGDYITCGHVITKYGHGIPLKYIEITEAGHPVPDENGINGTKRVLSIAHKASLNDIVICLLSGGGSSLLCDVPEGCSLSDLISLNEILLKSGANISEMNCIRKHISGIKGGQLVRANAPATTISFILSDVIGDPPDVIASGPTAPDSSTYTDAMAILTKYNIEDKVPLCLKKFLHDGCKGRHPESLKRNDELLNRTHNFIVGNNTLALEACSAKARSLGFTPHIISNAIQGDITDVVCYVIEVIKQTQNVRNKAKICLLFGGEPVVKVEGNGLGGRNQHLALLAVKFLKDMRGITILSGGTDGTDGPTNAAGAIADENTSTQVHRLGIKVDDYINACDSYNFFKQVGGHVISGPTQTNVMDLMVVLIQ